MPGDAPAFPSKRRRARCVLVLVLVAFASAGCAGGPLSFETDRSLYPGATFQAGGPAYGSLLLKIASDKRRIAEHGQSAYLEKTYLSGDRFGKTLLDVLRDTLRFEIERARLFSPVSVTPGAQQYTLTVGVEHFYGVADGGVSDVFVFLPGVSLSAVVRLHATLRDQDGRLYLDRDYEQTGEGTTTGFADREEAAAAILGKCLTDVAQSLLPDMDTGIRSFWQSLGMPVPTAQSRQTP